MAGSARGAWVGWGRERCQVAGVRAPSTKPRTHRLAKSEVEMLALLLTLAADPARLEPVRNEEVRLEPPALTLHLPELEGLARNDHPIGDLVGLWTGTLSGSAITIQVAAIDRSR